jgi:hypothetical protein
MQDNTIEVVSPPALDIVYYFNELANYLSAHSPSILSGLFSSGSVLIGYLVGLSIVISVVLIIGIVYSVERLKHIRKLEDKIYNAKVDPGYETIEKANPELENKWIKVTAKIESDNESDWRQAIMEADIILEDILIKLGYQGDSIGERLKRANKGDFNTLDQAWEAHKIRNLIAHEGSSHPLTKFEARRVINLYQQVFREFFEF